MSNMSYCRFRNTLADLQDCSDHLWYHEDARSQLLKLKAELKMTELNYDQILKDSLDGDWIRDIIDDLEEQIEDIECKLLSPEEEQAREVLIDLCRQIVQEADDRE